MNVKAAEDLLLSEVTTLTKIAHATRATDAVHVLFNVGWQVEVNDVLHVRDVQTSSRHSRCDENGTASVAEAAERIFTFLLRAITVDAGGWVALAVQEVFQTVCTFLRLDEH